MGVFPGFLEGFGAEYRFCHPYHREQHDCDHTPTTRHPERSEGSTPPVP
jgi:hypothetical protein